MTAVEGAAGVTTSVEVTTVVSGATSEVGVGRTLWVGLGGDCAAGPAAGERTRKVGTPFETLAGVLRQRLGQH